MIKKLIMLINLKSKETRLGKSQGKGKQERQYNGASRGRRKQKKLGMNGKERE